MRERKGNEFVELSGVNVKPLRNDKGELLSDIDVMKKSLETIDEYTKKNNELPPINHNFVQFMREMVETVDNGDSTVQEYKDTHIVKEYINKIDFNGGN